MVGSFNKIKKNSIVGECDPAHAYNELLKSDTSYLIDVRSSAEWNFVGFPDDRNFKNKLVFCEWSFYPLMDKNPNFETELFSKINFTNCKKLFFICRSGSRSFHAANSIKDKINQKDYNGHDIEFINVKFGFEGDLSIDFKRGDSNGWKYSKLPWKQL